MIKRVGGAEQILVLSDKTAAVFLNKPAPRVGHSQNIIRYDEQSSR